MSSLEFYSSAYLLILIFNFLCLWHCDTYVLCNGSLNPVMLKNQSISCLVYYSKWIKFYWFLDSQLYCVFAVSFVYSACCLAIHLCSCWKRWEIFTYLIPCNSSTEFQLLFRFFFYLVLWVFFSCSMLLQALILPHESLSLCIKFPVCWGACCFQILLNSTNLWYRTFGLLSG